MPIYNFNSSELNLIVEVCLLGVNQFEDEKFIDEGNKIINVVSKEKTHLVLTAKQKLVIGSFLANWYHENRTYLSKLTNKMLKVNYDKEQLFLEQKEIAKLNSFIDLMKIFNKNLYKMFFEGTDGNEYRKHISSSLL